MAVYTKELATDIVFPNITIYRKFRDGVLANYEAYSNEGYVMYDTAYEDTEPVIDPETGEYMRDPETGEIITQPVVMYFTFVGFPATFNFANFTWVAVPRDSVDENDIYGTDEPDHEVM